MATPTKKDSPRQHAIVWRKRYAKEIDRLWKSLDLSYRAAAELLGLGGVEVDRVELWLMRTGKAGISFEKILGAHDVLQKEWTKAFGVRIAADVMTKHPYWISIDTSIAVAIKDLEDRGYSQAPVRDQSGRYRGVLVREHAAGELAHGRSRTSPVSDFLQDCIKVNLQTGLEKVRHVISEGNAFVLVEWRGEVVGIISYSDLYRQKRAESSDYTRS